MIEEYFSGFVFDVRSAFKGRFRSFSCKKSWLSCFNWCGIESRKQEDHEELMIFLQNHLIYSLFDQKLRYKEGRTPFYKEMLHKNRRPSDSVKTDRRPQSRDGRVPQSNVFQIFRPFDLHRRVWMHSCVAPQSPITRLNVERLMSLKRSTVLLCTRALMAIGWTQVHAIDAS